MPQPTNEERDEHLEPAILAAMIEDPNEDEEDKKLREQYGLTDTVDPDDVVDEDEDEDEDKGKKPKKSDASKDDGEDEDDDKDGKKPKSDPEKKPLEAEDDTDEDIDEDADEEDEGKKTRKEKRAERKENFMQSILKDNAKGGRRQTQVPNYDPLKYDEEGKEYKPEELEADREKVGAINFVKGANAVKYWAEQDQFWSELNNEAKITGYDPTLSFLSETTPDGKKNPDFDADKTAEINETYFQLVGLKQYPRMNDKGQQLYDPQTRMPLMVTTVEHPDVSYEKFARRYVQRMKSWADDTSDERVEETRDNVTRQKKKQGVRPGGGSRKSLGAIKTGDISRMSDEDFDKNEAEIDRQILNMLG